MEALTYYDGTLKQIAEQDLFYDSGFSKAEYHGDGTYLMPGSLWDFMGQQYPTEIEYHLIKDAATGNITEERITEFMPLKEPTKNRNSWWQLKRIKKHHPASEKPLKISLAFLSSTLSKLLHSRPPYKAFLHAPGLFFSQLLSVRQFYDTYLPSLLTHSQGGVGVFNEIQKNKRSGLYRCAVSLSPTAFYLLLIS